MFTKNNVASIDLVVCLACKSEFVGKNLIKCGVNYVVCIEQDQKVGDNVSLEFALNFYRRIFVEKKTICEAFQRTKKQLEYYGDGYVKQIKLLTSKEHKKVCKYVSKKDKAELKSTK